ncbi:MAG: polyribonucleotide nucleotidyltransferase [Candidatus Vogelbacteria bacterium CG10_big_fil_rev_8_21_14_0_10_51_16]|uniref:Polyribonucleotide nucleotidyltransferase n=1 Tax=Candidatus Vogelbacteria bacterium CG10_big_fil_rev_8_21_14_0_10_51_16 TaxID=1975045 RepID=A0A2H0RDW5_9BACT|nr:MAG: polyribonucleotide nucleotidyltransferase [Candidatus Vogelbacteria bacterium CG10_big_fil_rev_8_21_14_0_10_51_16]
MQKKEYHLLLGNKSLSATFTDMAEQASGSVLLRLGETVVLVTAVMAKHPSESKNFLPLTVDYEERFYASGKILGGQYVRREGRPTSEAILSGRMVDRTIRPLFDQRLRHEVQVIVTTLSIDAEHDPDTLAIIGSSLALGVSDIPWNGPVSAVRVGKGTNDNHLLNPTNGEQTTSPCELVMCGKAGSINMIEASGREMSETEIENALAFGLDAITTIEAWQEQIIKEIGKPKRELIFPTLSQAASELFAREVESVIEATVFSGTPGKTTIEDLKERWLARLEAELPSERRNLAETHFDEAVDACLHRGALEANKRADGRGLEEVRPLYAQAGGVSSVLHGTGLFYRGGTHVLSVLTLGGPKDSLLLEGAEENGRRYFMHHYNFPPFSSGETGRMGGTNRRMIGHGALAEKALLPMLPSRESFPYTIRIVSESLASNGSTSMASVCASTLALMDGGVPIIRPTAGVAVGLMMGRQKEEERSKEDGPEPTTLYALRSTPYRILTDIQGPEDEHGDMDFKVAGTREGITAVQMDVKVEGVPLAVLSEAFVAAKKARLQILDAIEAAIPNPRPDLQPTAPRIALLKIPQDKIGGVIGPGGKIVNELGRRTASEISIEQDGTVTIVGERDGVARARAAIESMTHEYKQGERFEGVVTRIMEFGAFVSVGPNTEGLVHISEIAPFRIANVRNVLAEGERVPVVVKEVDERGRLNLSIKLADPDFATKKGVLNSL